MNQWQGQCPGCHEWNTLTEKVTVEKSKHAARRGYAGEKGSQVVALGAVKLEKLKRTSTQWGSLIGCLVEVLCRAAPFY